MFHPGNILVRAPFGTGDIPVDGRFNTGTFQHRGFLAQEFSARGIFGIGTFRHGEISAHGHFGTWTFRQKDISAHGHFGIEAQVPKCL
jgi:hypothetical protein